MAEYAMGKKSLPFVRQVRNDSDWHREVVEGSEDTLVFIDCYNSAWGPCHMLDVFIENWMWDFCDSHNLRFVRAECDNVTPLTPPFFNSVLSEPCFLFYLDGDEVARVRSAHLPSIEKALAKAPKNQFYTAPDLSYSASRKNLLEEKIEESSK